MKKLNKNNKGFSLVELLVVIAIMVVLVGVIAPTLLNNIEKSREAKDIQFLDSVASAVQSAIAADENAYTEIAAMTAPVELSELYKTGDGDTYKNTGKIIKDFLDSSAASVSSLSGTRVTKTGTDADKIMVNYSNGHVIVFVKTATAANITDKESPVNLKALGVLKGKRGTDYYVSR